MRVPPLMITGMHRSGTSLTARLLQHCGLDIGARLMAPRLDNPLGYYEDLAFGDLNRALITAGVGDDPQRDPDWAFADEIVPDRLEPLRPRAAGLLAEQGAGGEAWGFKDPRTAVLLDFYDDLVPDARHMFVYRSPWDVVASLMRTHDGQLQGRAGLAVRAWSTYNARLLAFREQRPGRTVLAHVDAVAGRPEDLIALVQDQLDASAPTTLDPGLARDAFVEGILLRNDARSALAELLAADHPDAVALYERLEAAADLPGVQPRRRERPPAIAIETARGTLGVSAVVLHAGGDGMLDAELVARPAVGGAPGIAADAGIDQLPGDLVVVAFDGQPRSGALPTAVAALEHDPALGAVLLAHGDALGEPRAHDPLTCVDGCAAVVLRRDAWLTTRGFATIDPPEGFEAWAFAVGCRARGIRVARIAGALTGLPAVRDEDHARCRVLERHPALAARHAMHADVRAGEARQHALEAEQGALEAQQRVLEAQQQVLDAQHHTREARQDAQEAQESARAAQERAGLSEAERARVAGELAALRATRSWRMLARWWSVRSRLRRRTHAG